MSQTLKLFFDKINNIDKHLTRLTIGNRDGIQIIKNRKETGDITKEIEEIKKNHQNILQNPILNTSGISRWNGQSRQIENIKDKSGSERPSKQSHNP